MCRSDRPDVRQSEDQFTQPDGFSNSTTAGHIVDAELNRRISGRIATPVDIEHSEMEIHTGLSVAILVGFDIDSSRDSARLR